MLPAGKALAGLREPPPRLTEGEWRRERAMSLRCLVERAEGGRVGNGSTDVPLLERPRPALARRSRGDRDATALLYLPPGVNEQPQ